MRRERSREQTEAAGDNAEQWGAKVLSIHPLGDTYSSQAGAPDWLRYRSLRVIILASGSDKRETDAHFLAFFCDLLMRLHLARTILVRSGR